MADHSTASRATPASVRDEAERGAPAAIVRSMRRALAAATLFGLFAGIGALGVWSWLLITRSALKEKLPRGIAYAIAGIAFFDAATVAFADWRAAATKRLQAFGAGGHPKALIETLAEELLAAISDVPLIDAYDV
jgi:hypothetical protein